MIKKNKKVIIAMSGGVDSSVSAWFLKNENYQVEGLFMKNWEEDDEKEYCNAAKDLSDAEEVCKKLNIHLHKVNFSKEYWEKVFENFLNEHKKGKTPNPDILCNKEIKFKIFFNYAIQELQSDYIATGHYAQIKKKNGKYFLLKAVDLNKDQSYFLYTLKGIQLKNILFPIGGLKKSQVRIIAKKIGLKVAEKKDSTGICFIGPKKINNFLNRYIKAEKGDIITTEGTIVGKHNGLFCYTLGQRKGLGIGGIKGNYNIPWYVIEKNIINNTLIIAQGSCNKRLMSIGLIAEKINWINDDKIIFPFSCQAKIRYRQIDIFCNIKYINDFLIKVLFDSPVSSVTPGQSIVFYSSKICLGGGVIQSRLPLL
ncbi:tRNA 2-thiouridine(34) synthase MnmA [Buchnera aphidicola]|jgi:tRNA-specific 2-thiouridylase|uniref:tRNA-specific 2-thiouridylase MnmA n=1 Tax=Buchnera aphidicola subsp. Schizaphis graminum (strain Sg) TaxID=198804 RepID=MNMA_BUCAP|nr:tRNA 2-thiouridine(34) synthase MnmA [Buchnera aphidicola]Q8K9Q8.1 RecName: Full=tRNA-specific 2-thiouridylase MnmA [Buchnera aphidicola str. Sg (Schizaphis graminum)]AAM67811.1 tRNA (5-methylaminomethyl-2-thiouridylate)-methyltransferase [Buchnera aphidicola str. Sg (Schizaphis graminum)]AWI49691.1 tRNA 2-thiouridine(34) synthase MnmA [Buchnera aphidicola (Schizaphis graminum)]